jgi:hypothetical protein
MPRDSARALQLPLFVSDPLELARTVCRMPRYRPVVGPSHARPVLQIGLVD